MQQHGMEYWEDYARELEHLEPHPEKGMSLKGLDVFAGLVVSSIQAETPDFSDFTADDLVDYFIVDAQMLESLMVSFSESMEQLRGPAQQPKAKKKPSRTSKKKK